MTRFIESQSRWGVGYRRTHYMDGRRVSEHEFSRAYLDSGLTAELGAMESTSYGFRKIWETAPAGYLEISPCGFSYAEHRVGVSLRSPDGRIVYFQPGDDSAAILETIAALEEIPAERRATIAAMSLGDYFEGVE